MCQLLETLKIANCQIHNVEFHIERVLQSRKILFGNKDIKDFELTLWKINKDIESNLKFNSIHKLRIIYDKSINTVTITPYIKREIKFFKIVEIGDYDYSLKYADRKYFEKIQEENFNEFIKNNHTKIEKSNFELIFTKNQIITDTTFSNLVFSLNGIYFTPKNPLLEGTKRKFYLKNKIILEQEIQVNDLSKFDKFCIINSMNDLDFSNEYKISQIID
jgi:4-amino-4-deoxychorismate lyase